MKRKVLAVMAVISMFFVSPTSMTAQTGDPVVLDPTIIDPTDPLNPPHKTPIQIPSVELDGHTLYFNTPCDGYELRIVDGNAGVVYSLIIPLGCTQVILPTTLLGEFELQLITGNLMFYGTIGL